MSGISGTLSATFAGTGRLINVDSVCGEVASWAQSETRSALEASHLYPRVMSQLACIEPIAEPSLTVFRGRTPPFISDAPTALEMGPPPSASIAGRYSLEDSSVLYASSSAKGVLRELQAEAGELWTQVFHLPTQRLRIADLRLVTAESQHFMNCVLWNAELAGREGYPSTAFSQAFATWISRNFFDGFAVPGVRGDSSFMYFNVVVFRPGSVWPEWLATRLLRRLKDDA